MTIGNEIHALAKKLWPINRSITGNGVRQTLGILRDICSSMTIHEVPSGSAAFDWTVPKEWNVNAAYLTAPDGQRFADFSKNNLHLVGYSVPVDQELDLNELQQHLYSLPEQPDAIPYVTSYYAERWGFCLTDKERSQLKAGTYKVHVDSALTEGSLTYGELIIPGETKEEIFISTYVCHPSMANNELSGPTVTIYLAKWLQSLSRRRYTYRIVFIPETIGSLVYLSKNMDHMKANVVAGFNVSCVGDNRDYSFLPSRNGNTISDQIARHVLKWTDVNYKTYGWGDRGSDERQYCAPGIDLPIASMMRTKYAQYPEYHTSLDDLENVVTPEGLEGGYTSLQRALMALENNIYPKMTVYGEPQLGKRGLYPTISSKGSADHLKLMMDFISHSDGQTSLLDIAEKCNAPIWDLYPIIEKLQQHGLLQIRE